MQNPRRPATETSAQLPEQWLETANGPPAVDFTPALDGNIRAERDHRFLALLARLSTVVDGTPYARAAARRDDTRNHVAISLDIQQAYGSDAEDGHGLPAFLDAHGFEYHRMTDRRQLRKQSGIPSVSDRVRVRAPPVSNHAPPTTLRVPRPARDEETTMGRTDGDAPYRDPAQSESYTCPTGNAHCHGPTVVTLMEELQTTRSATLGETSAKTRSPCLSCFTGAFVTAFSA
jgi:hypothetical protein